MQKNVAGEHRGEMFETVLATWHICSEIRHFESDLLVPFCLQESSGTGRIREYAWISCVGTFLSLHKGEACVPCSHPCTGYLERLFPQLFIQWAVGWARYSAVYIFILSNRTMIKRITESWWAV